MAPQPWLPPVVIRLQVGDAPANVEVVVTQRGRRRPTYEFARCRSQCDIEITPGSYRLELTDSDSTRSGDINLEVSRAGTYTLRPAARDTMLPGALLAMIGPGLMGAGAGFLGAYAGTGRDDSALFWTGASAFAAGTLATAGGFYLYANRPRVTFDEGNVPASAARATPTVPTATEHPYRDGAPVPPGYRVRSEPRRGLMTAGMVVFGASYGLMAAIGAASTGEDGTDSELAPLLIPVVGPLLVRSGQSTDEGDSRLSLALLGTAPQAAGLLMLLVGANTERQTLVPVHNVSVTPLLAPHAAGVSVGGKL